VEFFVDRCLPPDECKGVDEVQDPRCELNIANYLNLIWIDYFENIAYIVALNCL
jgi:hypothetical protein